MTSTSTTALQAQGLLVKPTEASAQRTFILTPTPDGARLTDQATGLAVSLTWDGTNLTAGIIEEGSGEPPTPFITRTLDGEGNEQA